VIGYSRTSRAALAPFRRPQIDQRRTGAVFVEHWMENGGKGRWRYG
jgi:hypothetical protein